MILQQSPVQGNNNLNVKCECIFKFLLDKTSISIVSTKYINIIYFVSLNSVPFHYNQFILEDFLSNHLFFGISPQ